MLKSQIIERITPKFRPFPTNTYQHKFRPTHTNTKILPKPTNIHQNYGLFRLIPTHLKTHSPPHLFSQPKEASIKVASDLSPETAPGRLATTSLSSCSLQCQLQRLKSVASAPELATCHARRFHHHAIEKIYTCVQPDTKELDKIHYIFNQNHEKQQQIVLAKSSHSQSNTYISKILKSLKLKKTH